MLWPNIIFIYIKVLDFQFLGHVRKTGTENDEDPFDQHLGNLRYGTNICQKKHKWHFKNYLPENMKWNFGNMGSISMN